MNVRVHGRSRHYRTVSFSARTNEVVLIEQRKLPHTFELTRTKNFKQTSKSGFKDFKKCGVLHKTLVFEEH